MSLITSWRAWRPAEPFPQRHCCGEPLFDCVVIRHDVTTDDYGPVWMRCRRCWREHAVGTWRRHEVEASEPWDVEAG